MLRTTRAFCRFEEFAANAKKLGLEEGVLMDEELRTARDDPRHPLHAWAKGIVAKSAMPSPDCRHYHCRIAAAALIDFATLKSSDWLADGIVFGDRPMHPGDLQIGVDSQQPIERVFTYSAAVARAKWDTFRADDAQGEPGRMNWQQAGRNTMENTNIHAWVRQALVSCSRFGECLRLGRVASHEQRTVARQFGPSN